MAGGCCPYLSSGKQSSWFHHCGSSACGFKRQSRSAAEVCNVAIEQTAATTPHEEFDFTFLFQETTSASLSAISGQEWEGMIASILTRNSRKIITSVASVTIIGFIASRSIVRSQSSMADSASKQDVLPKPNFKNGRFEIPWDNPGYPSSWNVLKFMTVHKNESNVPSQKELDKMPDFVVQTPDYDKLSSINEDELRVTWLGHASVLFQIDGVNVLSDPVFGTYCGAGQTRLLGVKRFRDCKVDVEKLPQINVVIISHDHYDHLDYYTVAKLNKRFGKTLRWYVPQGTKQWMNDSGCENVIELSWGEEDTFKIPKVGLDSQKIVDDTDKVVSDTSRIVAESNSNDTRSIKFVFAPSQHWCTRTWTDKNTRLWGSWIMVGPKHKAYFAGDTGYCHTFKIVGKLYGPFDIAAIPIGAYRPREVMKNQHIEPEEAVKIHKDVKAKKSVAIHWGTFALAYENTTEPPQLLRTCLETANVKAEDFIVLKHGETRKIQNEEDNEEDNS